MFSAIIYNEDVSNFSVFLFLILKKQLYYKSAKKSNIYLSSNLFK